MGSGSKGFGLICRVRSSIPDFGEVEPGLPFVKTSPRAGHDALHFSGRMSTTARELSQLYGPSPPGGPGECRDSHFPFNVDGFGPVPSGPDPGGEGI